MDLLYTLLVLLAVTRLGGELAVRLGQPSLVGELLGGIFVGAVVHAAPGWFPTLSHLGEDAEFSAITDLGVFFLMLLAGMELRPRELASGSATAFVVALGGMLIPLGMGLGLGYLFIPEGPLQLPRCMFLGTAVAITAVPVAIKVLMDLDLLESKLGRTIVAAALIDDVLSLMLLSVLTGLISTGEGPSLAGMGILALQIAGFFLVTVLVGLRLLPWVAVRVRHFVSAEVEFSLLVSVALAFAVLGELLHMHFIIGAFVAGLFFSARTLTRKRFRRVQDRVSGITKGLLAPIFFASIGLRLELSAVTTIPLFLAALLFVAIAGKLVGAGVAARAMGMSGRESLGLGMAMSARGAVELIIADIALDAGLFVDGDSPVIRHMFSAVVVMAIVTTLVTPIALQRLLPRAEGSPSNRGDSTGGRPRRPREASA